MNLEELVEVWRTQDAAPLHRVDKTLLHLALRQEQAKLQKERRMERWIVYVFSAGLVAAMAVFIGMMIVTPDRNMMTGWDFAIGIGGAAAALLAGGDVSGPPETGAARTTLWRVASRSAQPADGAAR